MNFKTGAFPPKRRTLPASNAGPKPDQGCEIAKRHHDHLLAGDLLRGADKIAEFLFGDPRERRKVYHLFEKSRLPGFRLGSTLCARKSRLLAWIEDQEQRAMGGGE
jgi:hypothetical protein